MKTKYIIFDTPDGPLPITFPDTLLHSAVARHMRGYTKDGVCFIRKPISAGFCAVIADDTFMAYGESTSLDLKCKVGDEKILEQHLLGQC